MSPKVKKVELKRACNCVSAAPNMIKVTMHTEKKVAGRKTMVKSAMDLMTVLSWRARVLSSWARVLSWWARLWRACTGKLPC